MGKVDSCHQFPSRSQLPVQQEARTDIGIDGRTYHIIVRIALRIELLPPERSSEIPFIVQRQAGRQTGYPRALKHIHRHRTPHFRSLGKCIISHSDTLIGMRIKLSVTRVRSKLKRVPQMSRQLSTDGSSFRIVSFEKAMGRKNIRRAEIYSDAVHRFAAHGIGSSRLSPCGKRTSSHESPYTNKLNDSIPHINQQILFFLTYNLQGLPAHTLPQCAFFFRYGDALHTDCN